MNSELYDKTYRIPEKIINKIKAKLYTNPHGNGIKRAKFIVNNGNCTYQQLKRIKNFFDHFNLETNSKDEYELSGGNDMKNFIESTLKNERDSVKRSNEIDRNINAIKYDQDRQTINNSQSEKLVESENEKKEDDLSLNAVVIIFDDEMRMLMLKRSSYPDQWEPNSYSLPGGSINKNEDSEDAAIREVFEETGIKLEKLIEKFVIQRDDNNVEHVFISKLPADKENYEIILNKENDGYVWVSWNELKNMNFKQFVPNLLDYIRIATTKYGNE